MPYFLHDFDATIYSRHDSRFNFYVKVIYKFQGSQKHQSQVSRCRAFIRGIKLVPANQRRNYGFHLQHGILLSYTIPVTSAERDVRVRVSRVTRVRQKVIWIVPFWIIIELRTSLHKQRRNNQRRIYKRIRT